MAYIDAAFFSTYSRLQIDEDDFTILAERASDLIDAITLNKIARRGGITQFSSDAQTRIKKATAAQVCMLYNQGGEDAFTDTGITATLGKYRAEANQQGPAVSMVGGIPIAPLVYIHLAPTGLLSRGIEPHHWSNIPTENRIYLDDSEM